MLAIIYAELIMRDHLIPDAGVLIEDGTIQAFGDRKSVPVPEGCEILDAQGAYVGPGMIDIHTHGADGAFFTEDPLRASRHFMKHGTTTVLPALYYSMNTEQYVAAIEKIKDAMQQPGGENIDGFYMEGPYLNPKFGCDKEHNPWKAPVAKENYQPIIDHAGNLARVWCLAPERENILQFVLDAKKANPNARFTVAHSEASPQQIEALMPYGLCIGTHHTNATGDRFRYSETRGVCVDEAVNNNPDIYAELICDSRGIHVDPYMLRLVRRIKGDDRIILISDVYVADGPVPKSLPA